MRPNPGKRLGGGFGLCVKGGATRRGVTEAVLHESEPRPQEAAQTASPPSGNLWGLVTHLLKREVKTDPHCTGSLPCYNLVALGVALTPRPL